MKNYYTNLPILKKLLFAFLLVGIIPMLVVGVNSINSANSTITHQVSNQLASITALKKDAILQYFEQIRNQLGQLSQQPIVIEGAQSLSENFQRFQTENSISENKLDELRVQLSQYYVNEFGREFRSQNNEDANARRLLDRISSDAIALQYYYIQANKHPLGEKHKLDRADDNSRYSAAHQKVHPMLRTYLETFGFYDIFIVDIETSQVIYSVFKELDYATSLSVGPYRDTGIAEAFRQGSRLSAKGDTVLVDFKSYRPSYDSPASFMASPIFEGEKKVGVLIFQMPLEIVNRIMGERVGMGETGESYLVGRDLLMRSDSFLDAEHHSVVASFKNPEKGVVDTEAVESVFKGDVATRIITDYNGNSVVSSFDLLDLGDFQWAILSEQDKSEAYEPALVLIKASTLVAFVCVLAVIFLAVKISQLISRPINAISTVIQTVNETGSFNHTAVEDGKDEVAIMAGAFNRLTASLASAMVESNTVLKAVSEGEFNNKVQGTYPGEIGLLTTGINDTIEKIAAAQNEQEKQSKEIEKASEAAGLSAEKANKLAEKSAEEATVANRIKQALDNVSANIMVVDKDLNIIYLNDAVIGMMKNAEADIRVDLPQFSVDTLNGANIDIFHKNASHQRGLLERQSATIDSEFLLGGRTLRVVANAIKSDKGERLGTVVEWTDRTEEVGIQKEVDYLVAAASAGDLSARVDESNKKGFFKNVSTGLNNLVGVCEHVLTDLGHVLSAMAKGDLTKQMNGEYEGDFADLKNNANKTIDQLTSIIGEINEASVQVLSGSEEIAAGNTDLSQRTEEQASSLEETAASMEEMTSSVKQSSDNVLLANQLAAKTQSKAEEGGAVVAKAVDAMDRIRTSSKRIADIIGVIDEIAFQTNLLALNAAVEAARAGEQGRGFAVVAGEVRSLAQRSAAAAKDIKDLINDSVSKVEDGTMLVGRSGETLTEIVTSVQEVGELISGVAQSAQEQSSGIEQVNQAMSQMDEMTQQNAALVEEASAASEAMSEQAKQLGQLVSFFNSSGAGGEALVHRTVAPARRAMASPVKPAINHGIDESDEWEAF